MPQINAAGLDLIKSFEGCSLTAYPDPGSPLAQTGSGTGAPWTIGYGWTGLVNGNPVVPGMTITQDTADDLLAAGLKTYEDGVSNAVNRDLTPNQFAACVSFAYNEGVGAFQSSGILAGINANDFAAAQADFANWVTSNGVVLEGLVRRRAAEAELFGTPG